MRHHPGRFAGFAALPTAVPEAAEDGADGRRGPEAGADQAYPRPALPGREHFRHGDDGERRDGRPPDPLHDAAEDQHGKAWG